MGVRCQYLIVKPHSERDEVRVYDIRRARPRKQAADGDAVIQRVDRHMFEEARQSRLPASVSPDLRHDRVAGVQLLRRIVGEEDGPRRAFATVHRDQESRIENHRPQRFATAAISSSLKGPSSSSHALRNVSKASMRS